MTGLDPAKDVIVEIATLLTDDDLNIVETGPDLVCGAPSALLASMEPIVMAMHTKSGLLREIEESSLTVQEAEQRTLEFLKTHIPKAKTVPLCGNSIGTDRRFLAAQMPEIENWLHYRSIDVSSVKELARRWYPKEFKAIPRKTEGHRALDDIQASVAELAYYRTTVFKSASGETLSSGASASQSPPA